MSVIDGVVKGVTLLAGPGTGQGARKVYLLTASFAAVTAGDSGQLTGVPDRIQEHTKNGKTLTIRAAMAGPPGVDTAGVATYTSPTVTNADGTLQFDLGSITGEAAVRAATSGVGFCVVADES